MIHHPLDLSKTEVFTRGGEDVNSRRRSWKEERAELTQKLRKNQRNFYCDDDEDNDDDEEKNNDSVVTPSTSTDVNSQKQSVPASVLLTDSNQQQFHIEPTPAFPTLADAVNVQVCLNKPTDFDVTPSTSKQSIQKDGLVSQNEVQPQGEQQPQCCIPINSNLQQQQQRQQFHVEPAPAVLTEVSAANSQVCNNKQDDSNVTASISRQSIQKDERPLKDHHKLENKRKHSSSSSPSKDRKRKHRRKRYSSSSSSSS